MVDLAEMLARKDPELARGVRAAAGVGAHRARGANIVVGRIYVGMRRKSGPERVERAGRRARGVAERRDRSPRKLRALGLSDSAIDRRIEMGWLIPILYGVYAVGHRPRLLRGWHNAALLAAGERSGLSNRSAGAHWGMTKAPSRPHVIAPRSADGIKGIVVHRPRALRGGRHRRGPGAPGHEPRADAARPRGRGREQASARARPRPGRDQPAAPADRRPSSSMQAPPRRGDAESRPRMAHRGLDHHRERGRGGVPGDRAARGLPEPIPQCHVLGRRRDFVWPEQRIVVEVDGRRYHRHGAGGRRDTAERQRSRRSPDGSTCASRGGASCTAPATSSAT